MMVVRLQDTVIECLSEAQSDSHEVQQKALQTLVSVTRVSPQNRNSFAQIEGAIPSLLSLLKFSPSSAVQSLSLSILFNLSLNPNLKQSLADMEMIRHLNSLILSHKSPELTKLVAALVCSLAMLDKNKAKFGVAGTVECLVEAVSNSICPGAHHVLSSLAELVQFQGNCTLAVQSGAVNVLLGVVEASGGEDLAGTSLTILGLLARFEEGLGELREREGIVRSMVEVLKGRCMLSKEGAADILLRLFDEREGYVRDALGVPGFSSVVADMSVRGSGRAREKAAMLMKKIMEANLDSYVDGSPSPLYIKW